MKQAFFEYQMAQIKYQPERTCVGCFKKYPQAQLLAIKKQKSGAVVVDLDHKIAGRSVYLCKKLSCFQRATRRKGLDALTYGLKIEISPQIFEELEGFYAEVAI